MVFLGCGRGVGEGVVLWLVVLVSECPSAGGVVEGEVELAGELVWIVVLVLDAGGVRSEGWLVESPGGGVGISDCDVFVAGVDSVGVRCVVCGGEECCGSEGDDGGCSDLCCSCCHEGGLRQWWLGVLAVRNAAAGRGWRLRSRGTSRPRGQCLWLSGGGN